MRTMSCCGIPSVILHCVRRWQLQLVIVVHAYQTTSGISAAMASSIPAAATEGGTKMADAVAPPSFMACSTVAQTGRSRCFSPAFFGFVPPITFVPVNPLSELFGPFNACLGPLPTYRTQLLAVRGNCAHCQYTAHASRREVATYVPCFPVKPWYKTRVSLLIFKLLTVEAYPPPVE